MLYWLTTKGPLVSLGVCLVVLGVTWKLTSFVQTFESALGFATPFAACGWRVIFLCAAAVIGWGIIPAFIGAVAGIAATQKLSNLYNQDKVDL